MSPSPLHIFERIGIEIEYMVVDRDSLSLRPIADAVLVDDEGNGVSDLERGDIAWSNELVLHVVELKTNGPVERLEPLPALFQVEVDEVNRRLRDLDARLMPSAMHPWMDPHTETRLWPHECGPIYQAFDRIFDCRGHGWSNLQSMHINLPFCGDEEFDKLHAAIRLVLPILPALAASSPIVEGKATGLLDNRMEFYRTNCARVPSVSGEIIPEPVFSRADYQREILGRMFRAIRPLDPDGILQDEFLNARGAIARFGRGSIEIRVIDTQECPRADLAVAAATVASLKALVSETLSRRGAQHAWGVAPLAEIFRRVIRDADAAVIDVPEYLALFGVRQSSATAGELWRRVIERGLGEGSIAAEWAEPLHRILDRGPLARRLLEAVGPEPTRDDLRHAYARLCDCLVDGSLFP